MLQSNSSNIEFIKNDNKNYKNCFYRLQKQTITQTDHIMRIDQKTKKATQMSGFK